MAPDIDVVDERILYRLVEDARHTSAPDIAADLDVTPPTVRNRIRRLEDEGVICGYHAAIDYERVEGRLRNLFVCSTGERDRTEMAQRALEIPGVIGVREIMSGRGDLRITVVGSDTDDLTRLAQEITALGITIDDEDLVHRETVRPYAPFGPREGRVSAPMTGVAGLAGEADVVAVIVRSDAPIAGQTLKGATEAGLLGSDLLVVRINRDEETITPTGATRIRAGDFVTIHCRSGIDEAALNAFTGE